MSLVSEWSGTWTTTLTLAATLAVLLWWLTSHLSRKKLNLPPGPTGLPLVGSLFHLGQKTHETFIEYSKVYGSVFCLKLGSHLGVVLSDADTMKEVLQDSDQFTARPDFVDFRVWYRGNNQGLANMSGRKAVEHRRFFLRSLRDFGMGKPLMEQKIQQHYEVLRSKLNDLNGKPINPGPLFGATISNVIMSVLMGRSYDLGDPTFKGFLKSMDESQTLLGGTALMNFLPWLRHVPGMEKALGIQRLRELSDEIVDGFIGNAVKQHIENFDAYNIEDVMDEYVKTMTAGDGAKQFSVESCIGMCTDFFIAGTETLNTTLKYAFILLMHHPDIQNRMQKEIDDVVGRSRPVTLKDKLKLHYTEAAIAEVQRRSAIVPLSVLHSNENEAKINGYDIPANSWIFPNLYQVMLDEKRWDDPLDFKPERFLTLEGKFKGVNEAHGFLPFGIGKRMCPGMALAKMELSIILPNLLQNFTVKAPSADRMPRMEDASCGIVLAPKPFEVCFVPR